MTDQERLEYAIQEAEKLRDEINRLADENSPEIERLTILRNIALTRIGLIITRCHREGISLILWVKENK